ncbi:hypothetical protein UK23_06290 [Lentzea aerocolonigenes]|uniref:Carrier domain-containing protein n=2 Tax=Lentzea aerocolonigenes TaxID=68170 RepID=A0A0F0HB94_LENAE|nr:hypothetical protein UK23_06290 [Lentzea aerocolonigenes]
MPVAAEWPPEFEKVLREHLPLLPAGEQLAPDAQLSAIGLDSLSIVQLLITLEDTFAVEIPDELLSVRTFATAGALWTAISGLLG